MTQQRYNTDNSKPNITQNVCKKIIDHARDHRQTKALACYYLLKYFFRNSRIYNHRPRMAELAARLRISTRTLYNYFAYLKSQGLISSQGDHALLTGTTKIKRYHKERKKYQITLTDQETIETVEARLLGKLLEDHARKIEFHKRIRRFQNRYHRSRNTFKKRCHERGPGYTVSIRNLQKVFNLGQNKAIRAILLLNDLGVIRTVKTRAHAAGRAPNHAVNYMEGLPGFYFVRNGVMYIQYGNSHELLEHAPPTKDLTYRQYVMIYRKQNYA